MSSISSIINSQMVSSFIIEECRETQPCRHYCKIVLVNGENREALLDGNDICILVNAIAKEKITVAEGIDHFKEYENNVKNRFLEANKILSKFAKRTPEGIFSKFFNIKSANTAAKGALVGGFLANIILDVAYFVLPRLGFSSIARIPLVTVCEYSFMAASGLYGTAMILGIVVFVGNRLNPSTRVIHLSPSNQHI